MALNLLDRISAMANDLSKSERKIAAAVLAQPQLTVSESIAQLAKRAEVSEPTVCRFCKRFGANGFPDFKLALGATMAKDSHSLPESSEMPPRSCLPRRSCQSVLFLDSLPLPPPGNPFDATEYTGPLRESQS